MGTRCARTTLAMQSAPHFLALLVILKGIYNGNFPPSAMESLTCELL